MIFFWLTSRLAFANEVILLERGKWWKILGRGGDLASGRAGELFLLGLFQFFFTYLFATMFYLGDLPDRPGDGRRGDDLGRARRLAVRPAGCSRLPIWLVTAFFAVARFLAYIDQRIRLEGWEVELRLRAVGEAMQEARRW